MTQHIKCLNCGQELNKSDKYCSHCGQINRENNLNFKYFVSEFLSANFNVDSKIFLTLKLLITSPATLTKEFLEGKRTKYITPVRLYLIISLVYFFVLSFGGYEENLGGDSIIKFNATDTTLSSPVINLNDSLTPSKIIKSPIVTGNIDEQTFSNIIDSLAVSDSRITEIGEMTLEDSTSIIRDKLLPKLKILNTDSGKLDFWRQLTEYASVGMFLLMPFSALILFGLFSSREYYIQHLILSLHMHSLAFLLFTFFNLIAMMISWSYFSTIEISILLIIVYLWLKYFYDLGWGKAIWKTLLFLIFYDIILLVFFIIIIGFSLFNF